MRVSSIVRRASMIASATYIAFLVLFSFDTLEQGLSLAFFIHNVPAMVLAFATLASCKWPLVGSLSYCVAALLYGVMVVRLVVSFRLT